MHMTNNTILITGGGSGIGRALAEAFHGLGNEVIIAGRREAVLGEVAAANPGMKTAVLDIQSAEAIKDFARQLVADYPVLNVVIHNAGIMRDEDVKSGDLETAEATVATNLLGPIRLNAALLPTLLAQPRAAVLKAAIHSYTQALRYQLQDTGVQVVELAPPFVQTELQGPEQAANPNAMPLPDYIAETMHLLTTLPDATEILVERVKPQRLAEARGEYDVFFKRLNDALSGRAT